MIEVSCDECGKEIESGKGIVCLVCFRDLEKRADRNEIERDLLDEEVDSLRAKVAELEEIIREFKSEKREE